ncbi:LicD family protein [bacterium]|nr:LicD family protein [bacterium]
MPTSVNCDMQVLRKLQLFETDMLKDINDVCDKYGVRYFAIFGTAIGAIRHKGFIPWDDDIDLGMLLDDYEKLLQIPKIEWENRGLELVTAKDDCPYHVSQMARIYKKGTVFESEQRVKYNVHEGLFSRPIWIDIFLYNHVASLNVVKKLSHRMRLYLRLYYRAKTGTKIIKTDPLGLRLRCWRNNMIHNLLSLVKGSEKKIYDWFYKTIKKLDVAGGDYITILETEIIDEMINSFSRESDMFPLIRVPFEDTEIYIQKNYDEMLTNMYGNYMEMPPVEKRVNHKPAYLDFGDGQGNVVKGD